MLALPRAVRWLLVVLGSSIALNVGVIAALVLSGESVREAALAMPARYAPRIFSQVGLDSWHAMAVAYEAHRENPDGDLYRVLFEEGVKFQYPPSSLLVMPLLPDWLIHAAKTDLGALASPPFSRAGALAVLLTLFCAAACYLHLTRDPGWKKLDLIMTLGLVTALGVTFYPLQKGQFLGQVQVYLGLLVALALWLFTRGRRAEAGVCLALCCLFKPQYGILLIWGALRGERRFTVGMLVTGTLGLALSLSVFGFSDHLRYLDVMRMLSRTGEVFWANQSVNGILHRLFETAPPLVFSRDFGTYNPLIYGVTLVTSALLLGSALWPPPKGSSARGSGPDFALAVVAGTMASPIAWEHHYGAFFPVFAVAAPAVMARSGRGARIGLWLSYLLLANTFLRPEWLFVNRWFGLLAANTFYGGLTLFFVLLVLVRSPSPLPPTEPPKV